MDLSPLVNARYDPTALPVSVEALTLTECGTPAPASAPAAGPGRRLRPSFLPAGVPIYISHIVVSVLHVTACKTMST
jgi:hypothetical protein